MKAIEFKSIRLSKGMTQKDLCALLQVTRATISSYENGRSAIPGAVALVMKLLQVGII